MLTASCPKCAKQVTVPSAARPESRVRCPLCTEEYSLEGVFADLPPLLVLLDSPVSNGAASASGSSSIFDTRSGEKASEADTAIALADAVEVAPQSHAFDFGGAPAADSVDMAPRTTTARPKPKKKANPVKSIIGVVLGGLVALPLAQLILWYLPGGWDVSQRDPVEIGRKYPNSLGMLAPKWVKDAAAAPEETATANDEPDPGELKKPPQDALKNLDSNDSSFGRDDLNSALTGNDTKPPKEPADEDADNEPLVLNGGESTSTEDIPSIDEPALETPPRKRSPVKDAPTFSSTDLADQVKLAKDARGLIDTATQADGDGQTKREAAESYLATMSELAKVLTFASERKAGFMEHVHEIVASAADTSQKRKVVSTLASLEFGKSKSEPTGTIFTGTVREIQERGSLFETVIEMHTSTKKPMSVYTSDDPQTAIAVGDTVAVLGVIIEEPKRNLTGYKGEPDPVVWGGYWQVVPVDE